MARFVPLIPAAFVLIWSTGFIGTKLGSPYIEPFVFLSLRFFLVIPLLIILIFAQGHSLKLPSSQIYHSLIAGVVIHGVYLGGVFWAIANGMPAGITAMTLGLQPLFTTLAAKALLHEHISLKQWLGIALGVVGLAFVIIPKLGIGVNDIPPVTVLAALISVIGISLGTAFQKRLSADTDLITATFYQYIGALLVVLPLSATETWQIDWSWELIFALGWLVIVLSLIAILLLMVLIKKGAVSQTASLFYLVPVATAIESYFMFEETLVATQFVGMAVIVGAILLCRPAPQKRQLEGEPYSS
ncbi:DMT family transporter [Flexibacterium corallicola]|uniref:DMT family transporter n=1 Tax=Flexibacterium corallicola TaxID=3037259 RepID=UPI00286EDAFE|nr:DMT family transporter [Pseudovibrio sp. M1P-2-3]